MHISVPRSGSLSFARWGLTMRPLCENTRSTGADSRTYSRTLFQRPGEGQGQRLISLLTSTPGSLNSSTRSTSVMQFGKKWDLTYRCQLMSGGSRVVSSAYLDRILWEVRSGLAYQIKNKVVCSLSVWRIIITQLFSIIILLSYPGPVADTFHGVFHSPLKTVFPSVAIIYPFLRLISWNLITRCLTVAGGGRIGEWQIKSAQLAFGCTSTIIYLYLLTYLLKNGITITRPKKFRHEFVNYTLDTNGFCP